MIVRDVVLDLFGLSKDPQYLMLVNHQERRGVARRSKNCNYYYYYYY